MGRRGRRESRHHEPRHRGQLAVAVAYELGRQVRSPSGYASPHERSRQGTCSELLWSQLLLVGTPQVHSVRILRGPYRAYWAQLGTSRVAVIGRDWQAGACQLSCKDAINNSLRPRYGLVRCARCGAVA